MREFDEIERKGHDEDRGWYNQADLERITEHLADNPIECPNCGAVINDPDDADHSDEVIAMRDLDHGDPCRDCTTCKHCGGIYTDGLWCCPHCLGETGPRKGSAIMERGWIWLGRHLAERAIANHTTAWEFAEHLSDTLRDAERGSGRLDAQEISELVNEGIKAALRGGK